MQDGWGSDMHRQHAVLAKALQRSDEVQPKEQQ